MLRTAVAAVHCGLCRRWHLQWSSGLIRRNSRRVRAWPVSALIPFTWRCRSWSVPPVPTPPSCLGSAPPGSRSCCTRLTGSGSGRWRAGPPPSAAAARPAATCPGTAAARTTRTEPSLPAGAGPAPLPDRKVPVLLRRLPWRSKEQQQSREGRGSVHSELAHVQVRVSHEPEGDQSSGVLSSRLR